MVNETFGEYIHRLRVDSTLTLTKLAAALDIDQSTLSKIENGKRTVSENLLPKLAETFLLDLNELKKEFYSEKIAKILYSQSNPSELIKLAKEKTEYFIEKNQKQGKLNF